MNMNNERDNRNTNSKEEPKRKYRLNKKKFAIAMSVLCFAAAALMVAIYYLMSAEEREAVAALNPPQQTPGSQATAEISKSIYGRLIVVDAGHGGFDPGATGVSGTREDELNLKVAFLLKAELESMGAEVIMTRSDENALAETKDADMAKRREIITQSGSDIVVSVHMNSFPDDPEVSGPLVLFMKGSANGKKLAQAIIDSMNAELEPDKKGRSRSESNLFILKSGNQPCVIVECGYISNAKEEEKLVTDDYQRKVVKAICSGVAVYFNG